MFKNFQPVFVFSLLPYAKYNSTIAFTKFLHLPLICTLRCWALSKEVSSTISWVFGINWPASEPCSPRPLTNQPIGIMVRVFGIKQFITYSYTAPRKSYKFISSSQSNQKCSKSDWTKNIYLSLWKHIFMFAPSVKLWQLNKFHQLSRLKMKERK